MAKIKVYYDYDIEGKLVPLWYVVRFGAGKLDWTKNMIYIPVEAPFELMEAEEFSSTDLGISVYMDDLTVNPDKPGTFGIRLAPVKQRIEELGFDVYDIELFVLQVADIEEVLQMTIIRDRIAQMKGGEG